MADRNAQVIEFVRAELGREPDLGSKALFQRAQEVEPSLKGESVQQFHARYVLPVKRERRSGDAPRRARAKRAAKAESVEASPRKTSGRRGSAAAKSEGQSAESRQQGGDPASREAVRAVFVRFAQEFGAAESRSDIIRVMGDIDKYVEEVVSRVR
jgi:hypothetical protein